MDRLTIEEIKKVVRVLERNAQKPVDGFYVVPDTPANRKLAEFIKQFDTDWQDEQGQTPLLGKE